MQFLGAPKSNGQSLGHPQKAEYRAVASTAVELTWIQSLLIELGVTSSATPTVYCDNIGTTYLLCQSRLSLRMKHIEIDFCFVRDKVQQGQLHVSHVSSKNQLADILTKPL